MGDIYKSITISGVDHLKVDAFLKGMESVDTSCLDGWHVEMTGGNLTISVGIPAETEAAKIIALAAAVRALLQSTFGKIPGNAVDIAAGSKLLTGRDARK